MARASCGNYDGPIPNVAPTMGSMFGMGRRTMGAVDPGTALVQSLDAWFSDRHTKAHRRGMGATAIERPKRTMRGACCAPRANTLGALLATCMGKKPTMRDTIARANAVSSPTIGSFPWITAADQYLDDVTAQTSASSPASALYYSTHDVVNEKIRVNNFLTGTLIPQWNTCAASNAEGDPTGTQIAADLGAWYQAWQEFTQTGVEQYEGWPDEAEWDQAVGLEAQLSALVARVNAYCGGSLVFGAASSSVASDLDVPGWLGGLPKTENLLMALAIAGVVLVGAVVVIEAFEAYELTTVAKGIL